MDKNTLTPEKLNEWLQITETIAKTLGLDSATENIESVFTPQSDDHLPTVFLEDSTLKVGGTAIPLVSRPKTARLVRAFLDKTDQYLSKEVIMEKVYEVSAEASLRMQQSNSQNLLKLMSRSRSFLSDACSSASGPVKIEWFPFDKAENSWKLYEFRSVGKGL